MGVFKRRYRDKETGKHVTGDHWFIDYRDLMGRRVIQKVGPSKRIAEQVLAKRLTEVAENRHLDRRKVTRIRIKDFAEEYLSWAKINHRPTKFTQNTRSGTSSSTFRENFFLRSLLRMWKTSRG